jgi:Tfp pilus assembly protein PilF
MHATRAASMVLLVLGAGTLAATRPARGQKVPHRPKLPADADTNSADAYYAYGVQVLRDKPGDAAKAFYWAHRLVPDWPDPLYARWVALLLDRINILPGYLEGNRRVMRSREVRSIDSLYYQALSLNPFVYRRYDHLLFDEYLDILIRRIELHTGQQIDRGEAQYEFDSEINRDPALRAWISYSQGQFASAVAAYTAALHGAKYKTGLLAARARASFAAGDYDAALADMTTALEQLRSSDEQKLVHLYDSKAIFEHSIAIVHEMRHEFVAAREAYASALEEDLTYYQAHVRLAALALLAADTATAISEDELAAQIRAGEPTVEKQLGVLLAATGRGTEAEAHFKAAIADDPVYAPPYLELAKTYEALGQPDSARAEYDAFTARAARDNPGLAFARARAAALRGPKPPERKP